MSVLDVVLYVLVGGGALLALVRLARGPSLLDRVVATDTLLVIVAAGLAVHAALRRDPTLVPVLVVVSLLAFVGSVSVARYVGAMLLRSDTGDGRDLGLPVAAEVGASEVGAAEVRAAEVRASEVRASEVEEDRP